MDTGRRMRGRRTILVVVVTFAMLGAACGGSGGDIPDSLALAAAPDTTTTALPTTSAPATTTTSTVPPTTTSTIPYDPLRTWVATALPSVPYLVAYDEPGGSPVALEFTVPNPHQFDGPLTLMITEGQPGDEWVKVQLPVRPNGQEAWILAADYDIAGTRIRAEVDLAARSVKVFDGEDVIAETEAVIGTNATPTPLGTFSIAAKRVNPESESYLGPWALALSAYSEVYDTFNGGIPVIAIHGTNRPEQVGQALSNGCIRIPNDVVTFLAENVPLGAPVTITA